MDCILAVTENGTLKHPGSPYNISKDIEHLYNQIIKNRTTDIYKSATKIVQRNPGPTYNHETREAGWRRGHTLTT